MVKKGHPRPGFEPTPLEGSKKEMNFCLKLYHWATGASTLKLYRIVCYKWKGSKINYIYLQFTEIVWKNGKCSFSLNSLAQSENCLWYGLVCIKTSVKSGSKESKLFKKLTFTLWQVWLGIQSNEISSWLFTKLNDFLPFFISVHQSFA